MWEHMWKAWCLVVAVAVAVAICGKPGGGCGRGRGLVVVAVAVAVAVAWPAVGTMGNGQPWATDSVASHTGRLLWAKIVMSFAHLAQ